MYLDDVLISSRTHVQHAAMVTTLVISFLRYILGQGCVKMDPAKVKALAAWPTSTSRKQPQRFLGFANFYRRFIWIYGKIAAPITALTSCNVPFQWSDEAEQAFHTLKARFTTAPILPTRDPTWQFVVKVDPSDSGVGGILSQSTEKAQASTLRLLFKTVLTGWAERQHW